MKAIGVVILHFKSLSNTKECLESALSMSIPSGYELKVIVVDNASGEEFSYSKKDVLVLRNQKNSGFTGGMNSGIKTVINEGCDYVVTINNDTIFDKKFIEEIIPEIESRNDVGIFSPKIYFYPGTEFHYDRYKDSERGKVLWYAGGMIDWKNFLPSHRGVDEIDKGQFDDEKGIDFATGCCMVYKSGLIEEVGMFDNKYFLYYEDVDLSLRMKKAGKKLLFVPKAVIWHKNAKSAGGVGSELQDYYSTRNRLHAGMRFASGKVKMALLREALGQLFNGRKWQKTGVKDFFAGRMGKGSFPI